ncbi:MAG: RNase adapter RapZ [Acidimicrobiia bacterium]|nr:RNase adapter RapZ [Acidimicrobiia bacterium]
MASRAKVVPQCVVVTGLSGAGKSQAIHALEDLGYFCIDNLPIALIGTFADLSVREEDPKPRVAVVVDVREGRNLSRLPAVYRKLKRRGDLHASLVFLEADEDILVRRFSETRRPHPLGRKMSPVEAVKEERRQMAPLRALADHVIDTSKRSVHELRRRVFALGGDGTEEKLVVTVQSFGFKRGAPTDADLLFDVRFLKNPHFVANLRPLTGLDPKVARYVMREPAAKRFLTLTAALMRFLLPQYIAEGKAYLTVAIGCTGGRHRSVAIAEVLGRLLKRTKGVQLRVRHRDAADV